MKKNRLKYGDKIKVKHFNKYVDRYFISYFKNGVLSSKEPLYDINGGTISICITGNCFYNKYYKEYNSIIGDIKEVEIDGYKYNVEIKELINK